MHEFLLHSATTNLNPRTERQILLTYPNMILFPLLYYTSEGYVTHVGARYVEVHSTDMFFAHVQISYTREA